MRYLIAALILSLSSLAAAEVHCWDQCYTIGPYDCPEGTVSLLLLPTDDGCAEAMRDDGADAT